MDPFSLLVSNLQQLGFYGFVLPFIFVFAIVFGLLLKNKLLGEDKNIIGVVSLVVAFFVTGYAAVPIGKVLSNLFGAMAVILGGILVVVLLAHMAGFDLKAFSDKKSILAVLVVVGIILFLASGAMAVFGLKSSAMNDSIIAAIFLIAIIVVMVWFISKD